jgi:phosphatidylserine/phosphatidylglycerophosphate/cardiolipin synthase-like enzyme
VADAARPRRPFREDGYRLNGAPGHIPSAEKCSYLVRAGNVVRPLVDGEAAFTRICEAVEAARKSVWVTVAYLYPEFLMPGDRGTVFDVLDAAAARGVDVRVIFWRTGLEERGHFHGHDDDHAFLRARDSKIHIRWDRAAKTYCQHQKSWLVDAGEPGEIAFVGGINLNPNSRTLPGHANRSGRHTHDVYCELRGPCATDVHHNFVQRWNETSEREAPQGFWPPAGSGNLAFPARVSPDAGKSIVQIQRTIRAGSVTDGAATPGGAPYDIAGGEASVFEQYEKAIDAARDAIYIEDQYLASPQIVEHLHGALKRGIDVVFLCPGDPEQQIKDSRRKPEALPFYERITALGAYPNFTLAGIAARQSDGSDAIIYVHDKIMLVDDAWATIGSCNIATQSFFNDAEMNVSVWDGDFVRALRGELLDEHLAADTRALTMREAMKLYCKTAQANAAARARGDSLHGLAFALDPARYGL